MPAEDAEYLRIQPDIISLGPELDDFADTAAVVSQLDMIISVDTATAHLRAQWVNPFASSLPTRRGGAGCSGVRTARGTQRPGLSDSAKRVIERRSFSARRKPFPRVPPLLCSGTRKCRRSQSVQHRRQACHHLHYPLLADAGGQSTKLMDRH
jgi:hypothetical protein